MKKLIISLQFILLFFHCHGLRMPWQQQTFEAMFHEEKRPRTIRSARPHIVITNPPSPLEQAEILYSKSTKMDSFRLKSIYHHATDNGPIPGLFRKLDIQEKLEDEIRFFGEQEQTTFEIRTKVGDTYRPSNPDALYQLYKHDSTNAQRYQYNMAANQEGEVTIDFEWAPGSLPDIDHRATILSLAMMTNNAYTEANNETDWYDIGAPWNLVSLYLYISLGSKPRCYIFTITVKNLPNHEILFIVSEFIFWMGIRWYSWSRICK